MIREGFDWFETVFARVPIDAIVEGAIRILARYTGAAEDLAVFLVGFLVVYSIGRYLVVPAFARALSLRRVEPTLADAIERTTRAGVFVAAFVVGAGAAGYDDFLAGSAIVVAAATVALGFAAQDVVGNVVSGAFIVTDRAFNVGDWIQWDEKEGIIEEISFRATRVRTFDNEIVTVPNSELTTSAVTNPVLRNRLRIRQAFPVGYHDVESAIEVVEIAAAEHDEILEEPSPTVRITELGDDEVELTARLWIANPARSDFMRIRSEFARSVNEDLAAVGIDLSPPAQRELSGGVSIADDEQP